MSRKLKWDEDGESLKLIEINVNECYHLINDMCTCHYSDNFKELVTTGCCKNCKHYDPEI